MIERALEAGVTADSFLVGYTDTEGHKHSPILMPKRQQVRELFLEIESLHRSAVMQVGGESGSTNSDSPLATDGPGLSGARAIGRGSN